MSLFLYFAASFYGVKMKKRNFKITWYWGIVIIITLVELATFLIAGPNHTYIGVHDNLDIHIADYQIMRLNNAFFSHAKTLPLLGGIDRNFLLSEFYLYSLIYAVLPNFTAYITCYFLKIMIALISGILLGKDVLEYKYEKYEWLIVLGSFIYGLLPLYPAFSFAFASIPLLIYLLRKIVNNEGIRYYILLFFYPVLSYFTFFGPFIIGYILIYFIYRSLKDKKVSFSLIISMVLLSVSYILIEYRLFLLIFAGDQKTIRDTMVVDNYSLSKILLTIVDVFVKNMFHCEDLHRFVVMPIVLVSVIIINYIHIKEKDIKKLLTDPINLVMYFIIFNCVIYGLYYCQIIRELFEMIFKPLKGWQFNRTLFFNPFLWYLEIVFIAKRLCEYKKKFAILLVLLVLLSVIGNQSLYNDFYNTVYVNTWQIVKNKKSETLSYGEFYSTDLFTKIKKDIGYEGEYSVAYGFHPSVLSYNGISTLDGCLSYYYQDYKEEFRKIIAPALNENEAARAYYDEWGARAYIFSGTVDSIWSPARTKMVSDKRLLIDVNAFKNLNGKYIFSRIDLSNNEELGLKLLSKYTDKNSPYSIWLYEVK
jgi:hypothetical protein